MDKSIENKTKLTCLVVDDEPNAREGIINYVKKVDFLELKHSCASALEAQDYLNQESVDLIFLDINMPYLSGLDFLETLRNPPMTILTTAYSEYALEGYRFQVVDYLLKPITFKRFYQAALNAQNTYQQQYSNDNRESESSDLYIRQDNSYEKINWKDILYIEAMQNYAVLHFKDKKKTIHQSLAFLEEILPNKHFFRIHRTYLINTNHIQSIVGNMVYIGSVKLPVSRHRRDDLLENVVYKRLISK